MIFLQRYKILLLGILILGAFARVAYLYASGSNDLLWIAIAFLLPVWATYALLWNKDLPAPFHWNNGNNQMARRAYVTVTWLAYVSLIFWP